MTELGERAPLTPRNADEPQTGMDAGSALKTRPGTEPDGTGTDGNIENAPPTVADRYGAGVAKAGVRRGGRRVRLRLLMLKAAERQGWRCMFCERQIAIWGKPAPVPEWACTVEHIVQRRDGGTDDARNIGAACWRCNHERGRTADLQAFRRLPTPEPSHD